MITPKRTFTARHGLRAVIAGLLLTTTSFAQDLRTIEVIDYPGLPVPIDGLNGGAPFGTPWLGLPLTHPPGLSSYWNLDDNVADIGPLLSHGTLSANPGPVYDPDVPAALTWSSKSLLFSGLQEYLDLSAHVQNYEDFQIGSIAAWIRTTTAGAAVIVSASDTTEGSKEARFFLENGLLRFDVRGDLNSWTKNTGSNNDGRMLKSTTLVNDDAWHHVAVVIEPSGIGNLYVDGVLEDRGHQGFYRYVFDLDHMSIGRNVDSGNATGQWFFNGRMDDIAIWGSPLTAAEVQSLAQGTNLPLGVTGTIVTPDPAVVATPLSSPAYSTFGFFAEGGSIEATQGVRTGRVLSRRVDLTVTTTYYASCLLRREDTNNSIEAGVVEFSDSGAIRGQFGWDGLGTWLGGSEVPALGAGTMMPNTTYLCVMRIDAGSSETLYLKVYGPSDTVDASDQGFSGVGVGAGMWNVMSAPYSSGARMNQVWLTPGGTNKVSLDALRIGDTWESVTSLGYGQGCGGLSIGRTGRPALGGTFALDLASGPASSLALLGIGFDNATWNSMPLPFDLSQLGMPTGCFLLTSQDTSVITTTNAAGAASFSLSLPNDPSFYALALFFQWGAIDNSLTTSLPAHASNGLAVIVQN